MEIGSVKGIQVARGAPQVSYLFFATDSLLFAHAELVSGPSLKRLIHDYKLASGQTVNFQNSSICFSPNFESATLMNIKAMFKSRL